MNTASNDIIRGRVGQDAGNNHVDRKISDNITLLRQVKQPQCLNEDEWYVRMIVNPNGGVKDEMGLEKSVGQIMISKNFNAIHLYGNTYRTYLASIVDPKNCYKC